VVAPSEAFTKGLSKALAKVYPYELEHIVSYFEAGMKLGQMLNSRTLALQKNWSFIKVSVMYYIHKLTLLSIACGWPEVNMSHLWDVKITYWGFVYFYYFLYIL
jgi:hypothetical protein